MESTGRVAYLESITVKLLGISGRSSGAEAAGYYRPSAGPRRRAASTLPRGWIAAARALCKKIIAPSSREGSLAFKEKPGAIKHGGLLLKRIGHAL
jgi:hypothetical protein